jgi:hypothetical protein
MKASRFYLFNIVLLVMVLGFSIQTHADLNLLGQGTSTHGTYNLIYDTDLDITWYDFSLSPGYWQIPSAGDWQTAVDWADGLTVSFEGNTFDDWRLPTGVDGPYVVGYDGTTTAGWNITSSEMGYLFHISLGNPGPYDTSGNLIGCGGHTSPPFPPPYCLLNSGPFTRLYTLSYWFGTEYSDDPLQAWRINMNYGSQFLSDKDVNIYALAVHPGNLAVVPEPISSTIDIKPGSSLNSINLRIKGVIPVAILTTEDLDATTADALSVEFGPDGAVESHGEGHIEDVDEDGDLDLVLHFNTQDTGIVCGDTEAGLTGETFDGQAIEGFDSIKTVGCE